jgi:tRNA(Ile)-lysidine synthase
VTVLVAVSGGPDSVGLLKALCALKSGEGEGRIVVGHFNHRLRAEADEDEKFVVELCAKLDVECRVGQSQRADRYAALRNDEASHEGKGLEALLREERYDFLRQSAEQVGARYVATAHTADDQAETVLHRILRGTGLAGLGGIHRVRPLGGVNVLGAVALIRPLLNTSRADVLNYLADCAQPFRQDATNKERRFTRNRLRHDLLPKLEAEYNPQVKAALVRLGRLAAEAAEFLANYSRDHAHHAVHLHREFDHVLVSVSLIRLKHKPHYVVREVLRCAWREAGWPEADMGYQQWDELAAMASLAAPTHEGAFIDDRRTFPGGVDVWRRDDHLELRRATPR